MFEFKVVNHPSRNTFTTTSAAIRAVMMQAEETWPNTESPVGWMRYPDNAPGLLGCHEIAPCCAWMRRKDETQIVCIDRWVQYEIKDMLMHPTGIMIYRMT